MIIKTLFYFCLALLIMSCGTNKSSADSSTTDDSISSNNEEQQEEVNQTQNNNAIGKVVLSEEGCRVSMVLQDDDQCYYPVNLDEKFKVDGAYLQFQKYPSRAPLPAGCESCRAIQLENVVRLKR